MSKVMIQPNLVLDVDDVVSGVAQMATSEFEQFVDKIMALRIRRRVPNGSSYETELLQKINEGVPDEVRVQFRSLREKMLDELITPSQHEELIDLTNQIEISDADRLKNLVELAQLRKISLDTVMNQLNIQKPAYV